MKNLFSLHTKFEGEKMRREERGWLRFGRNRVRSGSTCDRDQKMLGKLLGAIAPIPSAISPCLTAMVSLFSPLSPSFKLNSRRPLQLHLYWVPALPQRHPTLPQQCHVQCGLSGYPTLPSILSPHPSHHQPLPSFNCPFLAIPPFTTIPRNHSSPHRQISSPA